MASIDLNVILVYIFPQRPAVHYFGRSNGQIQVKNAGEGKGDVEKNAYSETHVV